MKYTFSCAGLEEIWSDDMRLFATVVVEAVMLAQIRRSLTTQVAVFVPEQSSQSRLTDFHRKESTFRMYDSFPTWSNHRSMLRNSLSDGSESEKGSGIVIAAVS